ncbi:Dehydrogenase/reductase SDR family member 11 [Blattella germanica]|nr:Dehydrogenase/reductase SDR family member 11 [Blattella germanica]
MERWTGRVAVITGASAGIGAAIAEELVKRGLKVVGLARRVEKMEELQTSLKSEKGEFHPIKCDVTKETEVKDAFNIIKNKFSGVDILINNAGSGFSNTLKEGPVDHWRAIIDLNVLALNICTKEALEVMNERGINDGHIIHMNSVLGHYIINKGFLYTATKHAVTVLTEGLRRELKQTNSRIKITSLSPGFVKTEFFEANKIDEPEIEYIPYLTVKDIVDATLYILGTPPNVQINELIITPLYRV